jgi:hypothetical protein
VPLSVSPISEFTTPTALPLMRKARSYSSSGFSYMLKLSNRPAIPNERQRQRLLHTCTDLPVCWDVEV